MGVVSTEREQAAVLLTEVDNSKAQGCSVWNTDGGNNTQDKIFLLSWAEANRYLKVTLFDFSNMKSRVKPTAWAIQSGTWTSSNYMTTEGDAAGWWWLRSPGYKQNYAASVNFDGSLFSIYVNNGHGCVRPAIWIDLESDIF